MSMMDPTANFKCDCCTLLQQHMVKVISVQHFVTVNKCSPYLCDMSVCKVVR
jgi:hypothetical protein